MNRLITIITLISVIILSVSSCQKFLAAKPDQQLTTPSTAQDLYALLDAETISNSFPAAPDAAGDDYFLPYSTWEALPFLYTRQDYVWDGSAANDQDWQYGYSEIETANIILDGVKAITAITGPDADNLRGMALFYRGYLLSQLTAEFTLPYDAVNAAGLPGMPLRLSSDITVKTTRADMADTYQQIIADLQNAASLLPATPLVKTRPCKPAAYGALARVYLNMGDYLKAGLYADSCLKLDSTLIDYNSLSTIAYTPFPRFNAEVIFHAVSKGSPALSQSRERIDTALYNSYNDNDLRKQVYFLPENQGYYAFKGDYSGTNSSQLFDGVTTDELTLIRAESSARTGDLQTASSLLNRLLVKRWRTGTFSGWPASIGQDSLLSVISRERRKELVLRSGLRWSDLRRYGNITPERLLNGQLYTLPPGDPRYAFLLPVSVIQQSAIPQNTR